MCRFLPAPSARRATSTSRRRKPERRHFYPRPPRGGRPDTTDKSKQRMEFLSTPSARRATAAYLLRLAESRYFYPRPPRGGRQVTSHKKIRGSGISIHALREEGDDPVPTNECLYDDFYPRPPRGGRHGLGGLNPVGTRFLSTPSARRATYPRCSPCGWSAISIHALREEGDSGSAASKTTRKTFLSTPSARRATSLT